LKGAARRKSLTGLGFVAAGSGEGISVTES